MEGEKAYPDDQTLVNNNKNPVALFKKGKTSTAKGIDALNKKSGGTLTTYAWEDLVKNENIFGTGTAGEYGAGMLWKVSIFPFFLPFFFGRGCSVRCDFLIFFDLLMCPCR